jgi:para-aminobenzoate synthetase/4-amino-4-deoxychorismate lyase
LQQNGQFEMEAVALAIDARPQPVPVGLAAEPIKTDTIWLYHKTTQRHLYTAARASRPDCAEVLLWNERGELTEAGSANLVLELDDGLFTPPISSGLLAGTMRAHLLANGRIQEKVLTVADLQRCRQVFLINSVRKWQTAVVV